MSAFHCACGFAIDDADEFGDHLREVFTPDSDVGTDGKVHAEADSGLSRAGGARVVTALACVCGAGFGTAGELDDHFLFCFAPADGIGVDGRRHGLADTSTPDRWWVA